MKRTLKSIILIVACFTVVSAQQAETRTGAAAGNEASTSANKDVNIQSGTHIKGELQNTLDVRNAKVGDRVVLKTTEAIKSEGRKVVSKGAKLLGHVTDVTRKTKSNGESRIGILFDRMQDGPLSSPIIATISSIRGPKTNARLDENQFRAESDARTASNASMAHGASGGGLVGGITNTVASAVNSSTGTIVGATTSTTNSVVTATGNTTSAVSRSLPQIQLSESSSTSAEGSSVLSLNGENLRLEKGTTFNLVISQSAQAGTSKQP